VLSRADEIGSGRDDALDVAARVGNRYQHDDRLRRLCPVIVPVSGLLGLAGETLREPEHRALVTLAAAPRADITTLLLTAERFAGRPSTVPVSQLDRQHLLDRLGLFGVRLAIGLLRPGAPGPRRERIDTAAALGAELVRRSGLADLRSILTTQFTRRARVLKARSALAALGGVLASDGCHDTEALRTRAEAITAGAHEFVEVRLLNQLRSGALELPANRATELERLLGARGHGAADRLGIASDSAPRQVRDAASAALVRWRRLAGHPLSDRSVQVAAGTAARTLERLLVGVGRG